MGTHGPPIAMETVLSVPELLEAILLHLDMATLLVSAPRVSKTWNRVLEGSPRLQQALFFRPVPEKSPYERNLWDPRCEDYGIGRRPVLNPLLVDKFGSCFFDFGSTYGCTRRAESFYTMRWTSHCHQTLTIDQGPYIEAGHKVGPPAGQDRNTDRVAQTHRRLFTRRGASWRRMLTSQPPAPRLACLYWESLAFPNQKVASSLIQPDAVYGPGLRMGQLYDLTQSYAGHHDRHSAWFRVMWGQPTEPYPSETYEQQCHQLLAQTDVLLEVESDDDSAFGGNPYDPPSTAEFDSAFRCDEHRAANTGLREVPIREIDVPGYASWRVRSSCMTFRGES